MKKKIKGKATKVQISDEQLESVAGGVEMVFNADGSLRNYDQLLEEGNVRKVFEDGKVYLEIQE